MAISSRVSQMGGFCLLVDAPHVVNTTKYEVDHNLQGVC